MQLFFQPGRTLRMYSAHLMDRRQPHDRDATMRFAEMEKGKGAAQVEGQLCLDKSGQ